jgi:hypothetical protein
VRAVNRVKSLTISRRCQSENTTAAFYLIEKKTFSDGQ